MLQVILFLEDPSVPNEGYIYIKILRFSILNQRKLLSLEDCTPNSLL